MDLNPSNEIKFISDDIKYKSEPLALPPLQVAAKNKSSFFDLANKVSSSEINLQDFSNVKFGDVYAQLEDDTYVAKYDTFLTTGGNQEEFQAQQQTGGEQLSNGLLKAGATALSGVASGTVGAVYGLIDFARTGNFSSVYDNSFTKVLDGWNEKLRYQLPNYYTEAEKKMDIGDKILGGGANFWANDVAGGLGFTVGAIGSELVWDYVTGGAALATSASRLGARASRILGREKSTLGVIDDVTQAVNKGKNFYKEPIINAGTTKFQNITVPTRLATGLGKTGEFANTLRFAYTSAGNEAGFEARHYMREMEDNFYETFKAQNNGQMPTYEEEQEFRGNLLNSANALYAFNSAVVGVSNVANIGRLFNIKSPLTAPSKWTNAKLFGIGTQKVDGELTALVASKGQKVAQKAWGLGRSPIIEGVWEEGIQSVGKNTAKNWLEAGYNPTLTKETYNLGQASIDAFAETYGTKEGWNEVGIGMIVGLLTGTGVNIATRQSIFTEAREEAANLENFSKFYSPKKMSENILYANRTQQDAQNAENAEVRGDFTSAELARKSAVISQLNFGYNLDYLDETVKDTTIAIDNIDDESIMKEYGVDADGANEIRETLKSEYVATAKEYKKYRDFSEYFVSQSLKKEGLNTLETSNLKQAIAYELTLGSEAYKFSSEILESLKSKIASGYVNSEITTAMDVDNILLTASRESQIEFDNKVAELKQTTNKKEQLEQDRNSLMKVLLDESQEQKVVRLQRLNNVEVELQELETERIRIEGEVNATLAAASLNNPFRTEPSEQYLTTDQIENLDSNLNKVSELANSYKGADPQKALEIQKLRQEYARSLTAFKRYADLSRQLSDPTLGLRGRRNLIAEVRSEKTPNQITVETLEGLSGRREQLKVEGAERILSSSESVQDTIDVASQEAATMEVRQIEEVDTLKTLEDELKNTPRFLTDSSTERDIKIKEINEKYDTQLRSVSTRALTEREKERLSSLPNEIQNLKNRVKRINNQIDSLSVVRDTDPVVDEFAKENNDDILDYKKVNFQDGDAIVYKTDQPNDWSGKGSSFKQTWNVLKFNQGTYAHVRILMTPEQKQAYEPKSTIGFSKALRELAKNNRDYENVVLIDIRPTRYNTVDIKNQQEKLQAQIENTKDKINQLENYLSNLIAKNENFQNNNIESKIEQINKNRELDIVNIRTNTPKLNPAYIRLKNEITRLKKEGQNIEEPLDTVKRIIKENPYLFNYRGLETPKIPSEAELSEYYDLATRALNTPNFDAESIGMSGQLQVFSNDNNLNEDEIARLRELNQLMSDWQLYGGALNSENLSINDIVEQQIILDQEGFEEVEAEVTESELAEMSEQNPKEVEGDEIRAEDIGQTYSRVFVRNTKYGYMISNLGIQKFLNGLDIADEVAVTINGNTTTVNRNNLSNYSSVGHKFNVEFRDGTQADISVEAGGILKVEDFNKIRENSLYKVDRYILGRQSGYSLLYLGDTQVESDFSRIDDTMSYTDTELYNLQPNSDVIGFQVNLDDPYNKEELSKRKTKKNLEELTANIKIYMVDNQGNILGDLKANRDTGNSPEFLTLRAEAARMALEKGAEGTITLPYQAPLKHLFLGAPNFEFEGDGYKTYDLRPELIVDFGYTEGGRLILKDNTKEVRKDLISKVMKRDGVPVIVFRQGKYNVAFPVKLIKTNKGLENTVNEIITNSSTSASAAVEVNKLLLENNLSPRNYNLYYTDANNQTLFDENGNYSENLQKAVADLSLKEDFINPRDWQTREDVANSAVINVDLTNTPLVSPKPVLDLQNLSEITGDWYQEYKKTGVLTDEKITEIANKIAYREVLTVQEYDLSDHPEVEEAVEEIYRLEESQEKEAKNNLDKPCKS